MPLDFVSDTDQKVPINISPVKANGKPGKIQGAAVLSIVSGNATVQQATSDEIAADPTFAGFVVSEDAAGSSEWKVTGDADLGDGVVEISEGGVYTYSESAAVSVGAVAGAPVPK